MQNNKRMFTTKKIMLFNIGIFLVVVLSYNVVDYLQPTEIDHVYKSAIHFPDTAFIVLKHPPKDNKEMLSFWEKNKAFIAQQYHIKPDNYKSIIFLRNAYVNYNHNTED